MSAGEMRYVLHIGVNKTGTSSLQRALHDNRAGLHAQGIVYPETGVQQAGHHQISRALKGRPAAELGLSEDWRDCLAAEAGKGRICVVSSEDFATLPDPRVAAALFPPERTRVVVYLREHVAHLVSWYQQAVQSGAASQGLADFAQTNHRSFHAMVRAWGAAFGPDRVSVRLYDRAALDEGDIIADFFGRYLPEGRDLVRGTDYAFNPSLSGNLLFLKRLMNGIFEPEEMAPTVFESGALTDLDPRFRGRLAVSAATVARLRALTRADRQALARDFGLEMTPPGGAIAGNAGPDLDRLGADIATIRAAAAARGYHLVPLIDRLMAGFGWPPAPAPARGDDGTAQELARAMIWAERMAGEDADDDAPAQRTARRVLRRLARQGLALTRRI